MVGILVVLIMAVIFSMIAVVGTALMLIYVVGVYSFKAAWWIGGLTGVLVLGVTIAFASSYGYLTVQRQVAEARGSETVAVLRSQDSPVYEINRVSSRMELASASNMNRLRATHRRCITVEPADFTNSIQREERFGHLNIYKVRVFGGMGGGDTLYFYPNDIALMRRDECENM